MKPIYKKILSLGLCLSQSLMVACSAGAKPNNTLNSYNSSGGIKANVRLSQNKVLQGSDGRVYLQIDLENQNSDFSQSFSRKSTDFIVVLDRSGSMAAERKMEFAHKALESLISQLSAEDRFGLITFDDRIETPLRLSNLDFKDKQNAIKLIRSITPRGSTNLGGGLMAGIQMMQEFKNSSHSKRILLISDGIANVGVTDSLTLGRMASQAANGSEFAVSTIGVGLDFNEHLMSSLADYGLGSYYFLESPSGMENILAQEYRGASQIYASDLRVQLNLPPGFQVIDASGYPITRENYGLTIHPGHLYVNQKKTFFITLQVPTFDLYSNRSLGSASLEFRVASQFYRMNLLNSDLTISCLPTERRREVIGSINQPVYEEAWNKNNYGRLMQESADKISKGDRGGASETLKEYKSKLSEAYQTAPSASMRRQMDEVEKMETEVTRTFESPDAETSMKRLGKTYQYEGIQKQRK
ncbi:MAG: VWA domain-containing protein [Deltaproteobacteria bacterium]|nr:VWA domain-containing protein [Deltaproteobacteria bacterium]